MNKSNNERQITCAILLNTIRYSHESRTLTLKCNGLIKRVLEILQNRKYLSYCHTYLTILTTYIIPVRLYQINISPDQWEELLRACVDLYDDAFTSINKCIIIDTIQMIIQYAYMYTNLLLEVKNLLPFLGNILYDRYDSWNKQFFLHCIYMTRCYSKHFVRF